MMGFSAQREVSAVSLGPELLMPFPFCSLQAFSYTHCYQCQGIFKQITKLAPKALGNQLYFQAPRSLEDAFLLQYQQRQGTESYSFPDPNRNT